MPTKEISQNTLKQLIKSDCEIKIFDSLESTNTTAKALAKEGGKDGTLVIARTQTGGKGRLGRSFFSPEGSGIYMSLILRPDLSVSEVPLITPIAALSVAKALENTSSLSPKIKWVNDIFLNGKKVCGILSEAAFNKDGTAAEYIILGIGINLTSPAKGFPDEIREIAGGVYQKGEEPDANLLISEIINIFFALYKSLSSPELPDEYRKRMLLIGKDIDYIQNGIQKSGTVKGIDERFRLIIKNKNGDLTRLQSGEVTIGSNSYRE